MGPGKLESRARILIVEDDPTSRQMLCLLLKTEGYEPFTATDGLDVLTHLSRVVVPVVIADARMPRLDGLALLREIERRQLPSAVVLLTGGDDIKTAVEAMRLGAHDCLTRPVDAERLLLVISEALAAHRGRLTLGTDSTPGSGATEYRGMLGTSAAMREVFDLIRRVAPSRANVLIVGENGTGKETAAKAIHELSARSGHPYVSVNTAALPSDLLEGELFGLERGAARKEGRFELARQGTLFLEEVADIPLVTQAKLCRVLEEQAYRRLGGTHDIPADVRVLSATSRDIGRMLGEGRFRPDLYFRLSTIEFGLPALRDRGEDLPLLLHAFLTDFSHRYGKNLRKVSPAAMERLLRYPWPGNVRELRNATEHAVILATGDTIGLEDLPPSVRDPGHLTGRTEGLQLCSIEEMQRRLIAEALARFPTRARAAEVLGVSPRTLYNKIRRYGLDGREARSEAMMLGRPEEGSRPPSRHGEPLPRSA